MRKLVPRDFVRMTAGDKAVFTAWMDAHGFNVRPSAEGGDWIESIDLYVPERLEFVVGPVGVPLDDCWIVVHHRVTITGERATPPFRRDQTILRSTPVQMLMVPPGCVRALLDDGNRRRPTLERAGRDLVARLQALVKSDPAVDEHDDEDDQEDEDHGADADVHRRSCTRSGALRT